MITRKIKLSKKEQRKYIIEKNFEEKKTEI